MSHQLTTFNFANNNLRVIDLEGSLWFMAADVCRVLGLEGYASDHTKRLDATERRVLEKTLTNNQSLLALFDGRTPPRWNCWLT